MKGKKIVPHIIAGAIVTIGVWALRQFAKIEIPAEVGVAGQAVISTVISVLTPDRLEADDDAPAA